MSIPGKNQQEGFSVLFKASNFPRIHVSSGFGKGNHWAIAHAGDPVRIPSSFRQFITNSTRQIGKLLGAVQPLTNQLANVSSVAECCSGTARKTHWIDGWERSRGKRKKKGMKKKEVRGRGGRKEGRRERRGPGAIAWNVSDEFWRLLEIDIISEADNKNKKRSRKKRSWREGEREREKGKEREMKRHFF